MHIRRLAATIALLALAPLRAADPPSFAADVTPLLKQHCVRCHGPEKQEGKVRLDRLVGDLSKEADAWRAVAGQLATGDMPPAGEARPTPAAIARLVAWAGPAIRDADLPRYGNRVDHATLFGDADVPDAATEPRIWRLSPYAYRRLIDSLAAGPGKDSSSAIPEPFGLSREAGFRDYAARYPVSGSELEQMALNARAAVAMMLEKRGRYSPPAELLAVASSSSLPTEAQSRAAVGHLFRKVLSREPSDDEIGRYSRFLARSVERLGNRDGTIRGLAPILLHPEVVFRSELGVGDSARAILAPPELALAISYALTDSRPDDILARAARDGGLKTREDVRREVTRLLDDPKTEKPRMLRFFQEYFGYAAAPDVFKDEAAIKAAGIHRHRPEALVEDTDMLVLHVLAADKHVLKELLTTDQSFVDHSSVDQWLKFRSKREEEARKAGTTPATHPFNGKKNNINEQYNLPADRWSAQMPLTLPREQRAGILTQPSWLVAHSTNADNHAIHRGKWVRERLLGGHIPETPITVEARLPDEPEHTLRHRMRVTREAYCWKCHQRTDPLGLPFEAYDPFGRHRTTELGKPVDTSGEVIASGDAKIDGKVPDAVTLARRLADSERVEQVFVRHAFRYWLGRNETTSDGPALRAAHAAYRDSNGSMKALVASLLTSDPFLYRARRKETP